MQRYAPCLAPIRIDEYIKKTLGIQKYKITFKEKGAIPLFHPNSTKKINKINIGSAGCMTRLSTGYTFLNIQEHSKYIRENIDNIVNAKIYNIFRNFTCNCFFNWSSNNINKINYDWFF